MALVVSSQTSVNVNPDQSTNLVPARVGRKIVILFNTHATAIIWLALDSAAAIGGGTPLFPLSTVDLSSGGANVSDGNFFEGEIRGRWDNIGTGINGQNVEGSLRVNVLEMS